MINFIRHIFLLNGNGYQLIEWCRLYFETTKRSFLQISTSHSRSGAAQAWKLWLVLCKNWDMIRKMSKKTSWGNVFFWPLVCLRFSIKTTGVLVLVALRWASAQCSHAKILIRKCQCQQTVTSQARYTWENGVWFLSLGQNSSSLIPTSAGVSGLRLTNISAK